MGDQMNAPEALYEFRDLTPEEARNTPSESGHGWTLDGMTPFFPGVPCLRCGRFVGRDGHFNVEHFEMSTEIASLDAECGRCRRA